MLHHTDFDKWAGLYDESISLSEKGYPFEGYYEVLGYIREQLQEVKSTSILDIGVGTGLLSAELYKQGAEIWGIDFSYQMLQLAKEKMPNGRFTLADFCEGVPAAMKNLKFDNIISSYAVHHIHEHEQALILGEFIDLLNPGGALLIGDIGFKTKTDREFAKIKYASDWDYTECYLIGDELLSQFRKKGLICQYMQISQCAGVLTLMSPQES